MIMTVTAQILDVDVCAVFSDNVTNEARKVRKNPWIFSGRHTFLSCGYSSASRIAKIDIYYQEHYYHHNTYWDTHTQTYPLARPLRAHSEVKLSSRYLYSPTNFSARYYGSQVNFSSQPQSLMNNIMWGPSSRAHPEDFRFYTPRPMLPIHPADPAISVAPTWKAIVKESTADFGLEWSMINVVRGGWSRHYLENTVVLVVYLRKCGPKVREELEASILSDCLAADPTWSDCLFVSVREGQAQRLNQKLHGRPVPKINLGSMVSVEVAPGSQTRKTSTLGLHINIVRGGKSSNGILFTHHGVSNSESPVSRGESKFSLVWFVTGS